MNPWDADPAFADLKILAEKLEAALAAANEAILRAVGTDGEHVGEFVADVQAKLLGFDEHARRRFHEALEDKRVKTLSQGNVVMTCVLSAAVALSEFKSQPRLAGAGGLSRSLDTLRDRSTNGVSLGLFAWATFYALLGRGAWRYVGVLRQMRKTLDAKR